MYPVSPPTDWPFVVTMCIYRAPLQTMQRVIRTESVFTEESNKQNNLYLSIFPLRRRCANGIVIWTFAFLALHPPVLSWIVSAMKLRKVLLSLSKWPGYSHRSHWRGTIFNTRDIRRNHYFRCYCAYNLALVRLLLLFLWILSVIFPSGGNKDIQTNEETVPTKSSTDRTPPTFRLTLTFLAMHSSQAILQRLKTGLEKSNFSLLPGPHPGEIKYLGLI